MTQGSVARDLSRGKPVREAQVYLVYLGFDPGPVDGILGRKTRSAVAEFQERDGIFPTGEPDEATLARLLERAMGAA